MIGRIPNQNVSVPLNESSSSNGVNPQGENFIQDSEDRPAPKLGVANVQDGFEKAEQDDQLKRLGINEKAVGDSGPYPGEEWLWQQ